MRKFKLIAITLAIAIALSPVSTHPSSASGPMFKVFFLSGSNGVDYLTNSGVEIVEKYDSFVLGRMDPGLVGTLQSHGFQAVAYPNWDTVTVGKYQLKPGDYKLLMPQTPYPKDLSWKPVQPAQVDYFVFQFRGPVKPEWTDQLAMAGGVMVSTLPENTVVATMSFDAARLFSGKDFVTGVSPYQPAFKIADDIKAGEDGYAYVSIILFPDRQASQVANNLPIYFDETTKGLDATTIYAKCKIIDLPAIARNSAVMSILPYSEPTVQMNNSRQILGVNARTAPISDYPGLPASAMGVWDKGLKGSGEIVAVEDTGLDTGDKSTIFSDFGIPARVVGHFGYSRTGPNTPPITNGPDPYQSKPWNDTHGHGTFTAGQIVGDGRNSAGNMYAGNAPEAGLVVEAGLGWLNPGLDDAYRLGARVHSNSWGSAANIYDSQAQTLDRFVNRYPDMLVSVSAANSGPGASTLGTPGTAKNNICVGASGNNYPATALTVAAAAGATVVTVASNSSFASNQRVRIVGNTPAQDEYRTVMTPIGGNQIRFMSALTFAHNSGLMVYSQHPNSLAYFSSRGPTNDNRIKPDLVAPGSIVQGINLPRPPNYIGFQGTSMSCPNVAGTAVLSRQWLRTYEQRPKPSAALVKALLINGARPITEDYDGTAIQYYPNMKAGWGEVDLYQTLFPTAPTVRKYYDFKSGLTTGQKMDFPIVAGTGRFKATLVWSDYEGNTSSSPYLVNNLDLVVTAPGNATYYNGNQFIVNSNDSQANPASRDTLNNVEGIFQTNLITPGVYTVTVQATSVTQGPQPFALVVEYQQTQPDFDIRLFPDTIIVDTNFNCDQYKIRLSSLAGFTGDIDLSITQISPSFTASFQTNPVNLQAGQTVDAYITLCGIKPMTIGKYYLIVRGTSKGGGYYHEDTLEILVRPSKEYQFKFTKGVQLNGGLGSFADNGKIVTPGQKLSYALNYDKNETNNFTNLYIEDVIPKNVTYNGNAFPQPTHYSTDNGATWINTKAPPQATNPIRLRWQLDQIIGTGRMMKPSSGVPGFDNVSNNVGSSQAPRSVIDRATGNIHVVWSDDTTGNLGDTEIFYSVFNKTRSRWEALNGTPGFSNISNSSGTYDDAVDLALDSNGRPQFVWSRYWTAGNTFYEIRYSKWNGTALVTAAGAAGSDNISAPIGDNLSQFLMPQIKIYNNNPVVVFSNYYGWFVTQGIYLTKWNGANWVMMNNTVGCDKIVNSGWMARPSGLALDLDLTGNPHVVYTREVAPMPWWSWPDGMFSSKWTPAISNWTYFNGVTLGWEDTFPVAGRYIYYPYLTMNGNIPNIAWMDSVGVSRSIKYSKFDSGAWRDMAGTPGYYSVASSTTGMVAQPFLTLQTNYQPAVGFMVIISGKPQFWFTWYRSNGWTDLLGINQYEFVTSTLDDVRFPSVVIDSDNIPYFTFESGFSGNEEVYTTYPFLGWTTNNYPGQIIWEGKIDSAISPGVTSIINKAYMSGKIDTLEYSIETYKTEASTVNPFNYGLEVRKTASSSQVKVGEEIKYTIRITNKGAVPIEGVVAYDLLPHGMVYIRSLPAGTLSQNKLAWQIGQMLPGASEKLEVWCKVVDAKYEGTSVINDVIVLNDNDTNPTKDSCVVKIANSATGYPDTDFTVKVLTKDPKAGSPVQVEVRVWASNPPLNYVIIWGDGEKQSGNLDPNTPLTLDHTFTSSGDYKVKFSVFDRFGKETVSEFTIKVK